MKKFLIFLIIIAGLAIFLYDFYKSGKLDIYLDEHPDFKWVPALEYYIGMGSMLSLNNEKAIYRFKRIIEKYPETKYAFSAQYYLAKIYDDAGNKNEAIREYNNLIKNYPDCKYSEQVLKRITFLKSQ